MLSLYEHRDGVATAPGNRVVYDVARHEARFGRGTVSGHALRWELEEQAGENVKLSAQVDLDPSVGWLMRCDRVDFPPGGIAYLHTHPGPGIRCLLFGELRIEAGGRSEVYGPFDAWFEAGPEPVYAAASAAESTAFVRVLLLPREWEGKRTIRYVNPEDAGRPKTQRATVFLEAPLELC
jgi:quercetin dioxygenase-like cupin family protein